MKVPVQARGSSLSVSPATHKQIILKSPRRKNLLFKPERINDYNLSVNSPLLSADQLGDPKSNSPTHVFLHHDTINEEFNEEERIAEEEAEAKRIDIELQY